MKKNTAWLCSGLFLALFALITVLLKTVDLGIAGESGTTVGFSALNDAFHRFTGVHWSWYDLTQVTGYLSIAFGGVAGLFALRQLIVRKSLRLVDRSYYVFGGLCALLGGLYVLFEKVIVNYRPVLMPGETLPEASFPSSHTLLSVSVGGALAILLGDALRRKDAPHRGLLRAARLTVLLLAVITPLGRLFSGAHWLTDILASLALSAALLFAFRALTK